MNHKMTSKSQPYNRLLKVIFLSYRPASSAVPQDKFSHFLNTVLTLRIHPCIVKIGVAKSFIQYHLNLYTRFVQFHAISKRLDLQKVVLPHRQKCRRIIPGIPRIGIQVIVLDIGSAQNCFQSGSRIPFIRSLYPVGSTGKSKHTHRTYLFRW